MSEMLIRPLSTEVDDTFVHSPETSEEDDFSFVGTANLDVAAIERIMNELDQKTRLPFEKVPIATPFDAHELPPTDWTVTHQAGVLTEVPGEESYDEEGNSPAKLFRKRIRHSLERSGLPQDVSESTERVVGEFVSNLRFHSFVPGESYAGECRVARFAEVRATDVGKPVLKQIVLIEAENYLPISDETATSSGREQSRGTHEKGRGLGVIQNLAAEHGGMIGRYIKVREVVPGEDTADKDSDSAEEKTDADAQAATCGSWVVWASFQASIPLDNGVIKEV